MCVHTCLGIRLVPMHTLLFLVISPHVSPPLAAFTASNYGHPKTSSWMTDKATQIHCLTHEIWQRVQTWCIHTSLDVFISYTSCVYRLKLQLSQHTLTWQFSYWNTHWVNVSRYQCIYLYFLFKHFYMIKPFKINIQICSKIMKMVLFNRVPFTLQCFKPCKVTGDTAILPY